MTEQLPRNLLTIYGRKPVYEALSDPTLAFYRVHLASSNKPGSLIKSIRQLCRQRGIEVVEHDRLSLSRISKNRRQDQGVAADILANNFQDFEDFVAAPDTPHFSLLAVDRVTNPQNLGMIVRAVCAGYLDGLLIPSQGCARIDGLVIKASAGSLFKARILRAPDLPTALNSARQAGASVYGMALGRNSHPLGLSAGGSAHLLPRPNILVVGNETDGLSQSTREQCDSLLHLPMRNGVESLNVAVMAGILAFQPELGIEGKPR